MNGETRRSQIVDLMKTNKTAISGAVLASRFHVSRQVIVQDIALLRAAGLDILSTNRGYLLTPQPLSAQRIFKVCHDDSQTADELSAIVDYGGTVLDVFVEHSVYGQFRAELKIASRRDVLQFIQNVENQTSALLKNVTFGEHFHTVAAGSEEILDEIEAVLRAKKYLK